MKNYENSTEVGRREGLMEGELRTMGMLAMEATEEFRKTTVRKEAVLLGSVPFNSWDEFAKAVQEMAAHSYEPIPVKINTKRLIATAFLDDGGEISVEEHSVPEEVFIDLSRTRCVVDADRSHKSYEFTCPVLKKFPDGELYPIREVYVVSAIDVNGSQEVDFKII
ncbi:hypothetical protein EUA69_03290 [TM7 phylum sp. oral taxon 352]|nr:hypothetical protein EUA73_01405 [TM7 phylum sp. oral taxon 352]TWP15005.1 hypothetical protein EUA74_03370 [TM7 phylum sp. oral taxon 352]TWP16236.1 hypothetical protein EUA69_03290 [TM7 phylum sp. oral taxon 352]TWP17199.1 hypothetical protein EUA70_02935 [TM7 phylum sp. oral taxon 352]TWP18191.1 hypothetical protein EUA71_02705 [TM7 phylum sp. oral taxon 352]